MDKNIDLRIKDILKERNMTSKELASKMGVSPQQVSSIINSGKSLSLNSLLKVADALDVELIDLLREPKDGPRCPYCGHALDVHFT